jgi:hypothetical protein
MLARHQQHFLETLGASAPGISTLDAVYRDNVELCRTLSKDTLRAVLAAFETQGRQVKFLECVFLRRIADGRFLQGIVKPDGTLLPQMQSMVPALLLAVHYDTI